LLLVLLSGTPCASSWAIDWQVGRGQWQGDVSLGGNLRRSTSENAGNSTSGSAYRLQETLRVQGSGLYLVDRRLVNASLGLNIGFNQYQYSGSSASGSSDAQVLGYNFSASILELKPYPIQIYANRSQIDANLDYGGRSSGTFENRGFRVDLSEDSALKEWVGPWFSASLSAREESREQSDTFFDRVTVFDQTRRTVEASVQKGFTTSDLRLRYLGIDQSSTAQAQAGNRLQVANANYNLDFGPGLNRNFDSNLSYATRNTLLPSSTLTATESLRINHFNNLVSDYGYSYTRDEAESVVTVSHTGNFAVEHNLYDNLTTRLALQADRGEVPAGTLSAYRGNFSQSYRHSLPGSGSLGLNWAGNYQRNSAALSVGIINTTENFTASGPADPTNPNPSYRLSKPFVIESTIRVFNVQNAPNEPELVPGADYTVEVIGNATFITPKFKFPSSPNDPVVAGDRLKVTYDYELDANLESETRGVGYGVSVGYGWYGGSYSHQQSESKVLSGEARFLSDSTQDDSIFFYMNGTLLDFATSAIASHVRSSTSSVGFQEITNTSRLDLEGNGRVYGMDARAAANFERYRGTLVAYDRRLLMASLFWQASDVLRSTFSASASNTRYLTPARQLTMLSARASLNWRPSGGWQNSAYGDVRTEFDDNARRQTLMQLVARTAVNYGKLTITSGLSIGFSTSGSASGSSQTFDITIRRAL
jgi:hypothetical protein